jgi:hypothetical protein
MLDNDGKKVTMTPTLDNDGKKVTMTGGSMAASPQWWATTMTTLVLLLVMFRLELKLKPMYHYIPKLFPILFLVS